jgi:hypothetical protein
MSRVTFPNQGNGDGRHQNAPADGCRHAPVYVAEQLPDGRRQLEPEVSNSDMRQFSDMRKPASAYHGGVQGDGDGRHQNAPADGRRHAPVYVAEQLPDGRRQLEPEVSNSDMRQFSDMRWNVHSMSCALWTSLKSSVAVTNG